MSPFSVTAREMDAIAIAHDELVSYLDVVGNEGQLDDEELPTTKLTWAAQTLAAILERCDYEEMKARGNPPKAGSA